jgi:Flp pilus assembly protein TadG
VEFSLVGGLFFFLLFAIMNAGFYLYGANTMQYAADIGVATIAAEGNYYSPLSPAPNTADTVALSRMDAAGLNSTPLIKIIEVDVYKENVSNGVFSDGPENVYNGAGVLQGSLNWSPAIRNVGPSPDYAKLVIKFSYNLLIGTATFTSSTVNLFRLEPQQ